MIRPISYSNNQVFKAANPQPKPAEIKPYSQDPQPIQRTNKGRKHISYWRSLGISALFGSSAMGFATLFCNGWKAPITFGTAIAGLMMLFDLPDSLYIGRK